MSFNVSQVDKIEPHQGCCGNAEIIENIIEPQPVDFVEGVTISKPTFRLEEGLQNRIVIKLPPDNKKEGYSVGGALTAFTEKVDGQSKQDILDATLLAQLCADKKFDRERTMSQWYDVYKDVLKNLGFEIEQIEIKLHHSEEETYTLDKIVTHSHNAVDGNTEALSATLRSLLDALHRMPTSDERIGMFHSLCGGTSSGNFQILPCELGPDGKVFFVLGAFFFRTLHKFENILFDTHDSRCITIHKSVHKVIFDPKDYATVRNTVSAKLGINAISLVASIELD